MRGARETALASSTYAPFTWRLLTFTRWNWKCHVIIVIKTDLSGFVVPMHSGLCEQYVKSLGLRPRDLTSCFARALVHWDNKPLQNRSWSLNHFLWGVSTIKWGNFGHRGNFGQYKIFILSNIFCHMKNNLVENMEVKGYTNLWFVSKVVSLAWLDWTQWWVNYNGFDECRSELSFLMVF